MDDEKASAAPLSNRASVSTDARASRADGSLLDRWRARWAAAQSSQRHTRWSLDLRLVVLTTLNVLLYLPWHFLRLAFDAGDHHPNLALGLLILTLWMWFELYTAILSRFKR
jgi:hypothetical protein